MKAYTTLCLIFSIVFSSGNADCPETEDVVWALGPIGCQVFRNACFFADAEGFSLSPKEECQKHCPRNCSIFNSFSTAIYRGQSRVFGNSCVREAYNCRSGETYI
ncbi:uncharacterized protein LOC108024419 isoform X2 [Drosophila biarmipes]|uniref:uncharacterized protein LOC108024419 isoform X2 n=1 Tax=Drosophila biarmipes TaxID=125945 RepID=UPI0007E7BD90|nr:uncharacterized protein LOC108024419 isoform X2 [Drosophila biarmipes]